MPRLLIVLLICLVGLLPAAAGAQTEPPRGAPQAKPQQGFDLGDIDQNRLLLMLAGGLLGVTVVNGLVANPATASTMAWLAPRLLVAWGAMMGSRMFGGAYDIWQEVEKLKAEAAAEANAAPDGGV